MLVLSIRERAAGAAEHTLVPAPVEWTRNTPGVIDLEPGDDQVFEVSPGEPEWQNLPGIAHLQDKELFVRAELRIPVSEEAVELEVFIGRIVGLPELSRPPHRWLFAGSR